MPPWRYRKADVTIRSDFEHKVSQDRFAHRAGNATRAVTSTQAILASLVVEFPEQPPFDTLSRVVRRSLDAISGSIAVADCHQCRPVSTPSTVEKRRPREFWSLVGIVLISALMPVLSLLLALGAVAFVLAIFFFGLSLAGMVWSVMDAGTPAHSAVSKQECDVLVDGAELVRIVAGSLDNVDDMMRLIENRLSPSENEEEPELPDDVIDLVHRLAGDSLTGRARDRSEDVADLLNARSITIVSEPDDVDDYRFSLRIAPNEISRRTVRPALVRADSTVLRKGAVLLPEVDKE